MRRPWSGTGLILEGANFSVAPAWRAKAVIQAKGGRFSGAASSSMKDLQDGEPADFQTFRRARIPGTERSTRSTRSGLRAGRKVFTNDGKPRRNTFQVVRKA